MSVEDERGGFILRRRPQRNPGPINRYPGAGNAQRHCDQAFRRYFRPELVAPGRHDPGREDGRGAGEGVRRLGGLPEGGEITRGSLAEHCRHPIPQIMKLRSYPSRKTRRCQCGYDDGSRRC